MISLYYSDLALQNNKILLNVDHVLNLKTLCLLSNNVLVPTSHLLNAQHRDILDINNSLRVFFEKEMIFSQLPLDTASFAEYYNKYFSQGEIDTNTPLHIEKREIIENLISSKPMKKYNRGLQKDAFREYMVDYLENHEMLSDSLKNKMLLELNHTNHDKEHYCKYILDLSKKHHSQANILININRATEVIYFAVGANTNDSIISTNDFFVKGNLELLNSKTANVNITNNYYSPAFFLSLLIKLDVIDDCNTIKKLDYDEIVYVKNEKVYKHFLYLYRNLSIYFSDIEKFLRTNSKSKTTDFVKDLLASLAISIPENILTMLFLPGIPLISFAYLLISLFFDNYLDRNKYYKIIKTNTVGRLVDSIAYAYDPFTVFCNKLKYIISKHKD